VVFTGHSLGGGLASAAALATDSSGVTFNAAGLSDQTLETLGFNPNEVREHAADEGQVRRYVVNGDPLTFAQQDLRGLKPPPAVGHELRVDPASPDNPIGLHGGGGEGASYVEAIRPDAHGNVDVHDPPAARPASTGWAAPSPRALTCSATACASTSTRMASRSWARWPMR